LQRQAQPQWNYRGCRLFAEPSTINNRSISSGA
jgi:hypothetical protein